jgi:hypothetical protein
MPEEPISAKPISEEPISQEVIKYPVSELFTSAQSIVTGPGLYANQAHFSVTQNEIIMDFYVIGPSTTGETKPELIRVQRILLPNGIGKGFVTGLANAIAKYEKIMNIILPNQRGKVEGDEIELWK